MEIWERSGGQPGKRKRRVPKQRLGRQQHWGQTEQRYCKRCHKMTPVYEYYGVKTCKFGHPL